MDTPIIARETRLIVSTKNPPSSYTITVDGTAEMTESAESSKESITPLDNGKTKITGAAGDAMDAFVIDGSVESVEGDVTVQEERVGIIPEWVLYATGVVIAFAIVVRIFK
jgi:hypothetical protein